MSADHATTQGRRAHVVFPLCLAGLFVLASALVASRAATVTDAGVQESAPSGFYEKSHVLWDSPLVMAVETYPSEVVRVAPPDGDARANLGLEVRDCVMAGGPSSFEAELHQMVGGIIDVTVSRRDLSTSGDSLVLWQDVTPGDYYVLFVLDGDRSVLSADKVELYQLDTSD